MNNYNKEINNNQLKDDFFLKLPSNLTGFVNTNTTIENNNSGHKCFCFYGNVSLNDNDLICDCCGSKMHIHASFNTKLKHIPIGSTYSYICIDKKQLKCPLCNATRMQKITFQAENHCITEELKTYTEDLLATNNFTNKEVAYITGLNRNVVKEIDKERLKKIYTLNGDGKELIKPEVYARYLGIDEFKLHNGNKYATHIIDYDTGHILWIAKGKKKDVVYDFINHVGTEWMSHVVAIACDMNSDFEEAFLQKCHHIKIVYDYFHIIKFFNENVISEIRKEEYNRLIKEGKTEEAKSLKNSKYILTSNRETLKKKDNERLEKKVINKGSDLFKIPEITRKYEYEKRYDELIKSNVLLFAADIVREKIKLAYSRDDELLMAEDLMDVVILCYESLDNHLIRFAKLIASHYNGIISHAKIKISSGKIEGINNKIKTLRRQAYGYPDDEYFFLKLFDMSRH